MPVASRQSFQRARKHFTKLSATNPTATQDRSGYSDRPLDYICDVLQVTLTHDQQRICQALLDSRYTMVPSSHGQGKTKLGALLVIWWVDAVGGLAITTAPTMRQVKELLWGEIRRHAWQIGIEPEDRGQLFLRKSEDARAFGFSARRDQNSFQGQHAERLLIVVDEACGVSPEIWDGATACLTGSQNKMLAIGNPVVADTPFQQSCSDSTNAVIRLPAWRHPNVAWAYERHPNGIHRLKPEVAAAITDEQGAIAPQSAWPPELPRDQIPGAISIDWIERARRKHGEGSPYWQSRVEAEFPTDTEWSIVPRSWFDQARARYDADPAYWDAIAAKHPWRHGVDVGDGGDPHGFASWRGPVLYTCREQSCQGDREDITRCAGETRRLLDEQHGSASIDTVGVGSGVQSILKEAGYHANAVNWGSRASDPARFANLKAEQFWQLREALRLGEVAIAPLPPEAEDMARNDLAGTCYEELSTGKIKIEDKAKTRKRLRRSPNVGDAIVYGFAKASRINPMLYT